MEVLPAFLVLIVGAVWVWLRYRNKQVTAPQPERGRADVPSPRDVEGHSGHVALAWAAADGARHLRVEDPRTGQRIDPDRRTLASDRFEVVALVDVDPAALRHGDVEPGVAVLVERVDGAAGVEVRTADTDERLGGVEPARAARLAEQMDAGRRLEGLVLRAHPDDERGVEVLVADRGVLPPVPEAPGT